MKKTLVVYYSRTGYTRTIAEAIATQLDADIECVQEFRGRSGMWGYLRSAREALKQRVSAIRMPTKNPRDQVAFFCTQGGSGAVKVLDKMAALCRRKPIATLILNDDEIKKPRYTDRLNQFVGSVAHLKAA